MARFFREEFDRDREFVAVRPFKWNGKPINVNDPIDKGLFTLRKLRQLYDLRNLTMVPLQEAVNGHTLPGIPLPPPETAAEQEGTPPAPVMERRRPKSTGSNPRRRPGASQEART